MFRNREMGALQPLVGQVTTTYGDGTSATTTPTTSLIRGFKKTTSDVVTSEFHALQAKGVIVNNPFHSYLIEQECSDLPHWSIEDTGTVTGKNMKKQEAYAVRFGAKSPLIVNPPPVDIKNLEVLAGTEAHAGVAEPEFNAPVALAELNEVFRMIHNPFRAMERKLREHKRSVKYQVWLTKNRQRSFKQPKKVTVRDDRGNEWLMDTRVNRHGKMTRPELADDPFLKFLGEQWLQIRYGILPLARDLDSALGLLRKEPTQYPRYTSRATKVVAPSAIVTEIPYNVNDGDWGGTEKHRAERFVTCRAGVLYTHALSMETRTNWSLSAIPEAMWEGLPASFVVDWVLNVGDYLRAIQCKSGVHILARWTKTTDVITRSIEVRTQPKFTGAQFVKVGNTDYTTKATETFVNRRPWADIGIAYDQQIFDLSSVTWRKRCLDVASALSLLLSPVKRKA